MNLKIQLWDQINKRMIDLIENHGNFASFNISHIGFDRYDFRYFTRHQDTNGIDVYTGDIVQMIDGTTYIVEWDTYQFNLKGYWNAYHDYPSDFFSEPEPMTIIGNIYQNPELIGECKK